MAGAPKLGFSSFAAPGKGVLVIFAGTDLAFGPSTKKLLAPAGDLVSRAAEADGFKGKNGSALDLIAPQGLKASRLIVIGIGKPSELKSEDYVKLGGNAFGCAPKSADEITIIGETPDGPMSADQVSDLALGAMMRAYSFDRYKTKRKDDDDEPKQRKLTIGVADADKARKAWSAREAVAEGVIIARDLVNEPANILYPEEFARRAAALKKVGVDVEILDEKALTKLKMLSLIHI